MGVEVVQMDCDESLAPLELKGEDAVGGDAVVAVRAPLGQLRLGQSAEVPAALLVCEVELPGEPRHSTGFRLEAPEYPQPILVG